MSKAKVHEYRVEMSCDGCSGAVQRVLAKLQGNGVEKIDINLQDQLVRVTSTLAAEEILKIIQKTGKKVEHISSN